MSLLLQSFYSEIKSQQTCQHIVHDIAFDKFDDQHDEQEQNETMPSMFNSIETVPTEVPKILPTEVSTNHPGEENTPI